MSNNRILNVNFKNGKSDRLLLGEAVQTSAYSHHIRVKIDGLAFQKNDYEGAKPRLSIACQRPDGTSGSDWLETKYDGEGSFSYFEWLIPPWALALSGDLKITFNLIDPNPSYSVVIGGQQYVVAPSIAQNIVVLKVLPAVEAASEIDISPDISQGIISDIARIEDMFICYYTKEETDQKIEEAIGLAVSTIAEGSY